MERDSENSVDSARRAEFHEQLASRLAALDRGETVDPEVVRAKLKHKSAERLKNGT